MRANMNIKELLEQIKLGNKDFTTLKMAEDIQEDFAIEEGMMYFKSHKRLNKIAEKLQESGVNPVIVESFRKIASSILPLEKKFITEEEIRKAEARSKMIEIRKSYDKIIHSMKDRSALKEIKEKNATRLIGEAFGTLFFAVKPIQEIAQTTKATSLVEEKIPFIFKEAFRDELNLLKKAQDSGKDEAPFI
jgi:hypothetical protein